MICDFTLRSFKKASLLIIKDYVPILILYLLMNDFTVVLHYLLHSFSIAQF